MGFEDDYNPSGTVTKVTRNLLGARGIDRISITENNATTYGYPLYDGHGNCRGILTKNGSSYGTGNWRTYDVWGSVRSGSATGDAVLAVALECTVILAILISMEFD